MRGRRGNDRGEMRWEFFCGRPLVEPGIGAAPHPDFAVAEGLHAKPFDYVMAVARLLGEWLEIAAGISAAANIDKCKCVTVRCEVGGGNGVGIRNVGGRGEED